MFLKFIFDRVFSFLGLILLSPFFLVLFVIHKIKMPDGPFFYRQVRIGRDAKPFRIFKIRTMRKNSEEGGPVSVYDDERILPFGKWLRETKIDTLFELINILIGDMSIVGPRPERPEIADEYCKQLPEFKYRLYVKAGLTGYAQVYGKYNTTFVDKLKLDMIYVGNASILLDIQLILLTLKVIFQKESTEGLEEGKTIATK